MNVDEPKLYCLQCTVNMVNRIGSIYFKYLQFLCFLMPFSFSLVMYDKKQSQDDQTELIWIPQSHENQAENVSFLFVELSGPCCMNE